MHVASVHHEVIIRAYLIIILLTVTKRRTSENCGLGSPSGSASD